MLKSLYAFSIALLVLAFVVFGVAAVPAPEAPDVPPELSSIGQDEAEEPTEEQQELLAEQSQEQQAFQARLAVYNQVVSFVIIGVAVALLVLSILWLRRMPIIGEGVTLGAVFTLLYGLYSALSVGAGLLSFVAVTVGLLILLGLVYWQFVHSASTPGWHPQQGKQADSTPEKSEPVGIAESKGTAS